MISVIYRYMYNKAKDHTWTYLFNCNSDGCYYMTTKKAGAVPCKYGDLLIYRYMEPCIRTRFSLVCYVYGSSRVHQTCV